MEKQLPYYAALIPAKYEGENIHVMLEFRKKMSNPIADARVMVDMNYKTD